MARLADENRGKGAYGLEELLVTLGGAAPWKAATEAFSKTDATAWPADLRSERCRTDAWASAWLAQHYADVASAPLLDLVHRIAASIDRVCLAGLVVDTQYFDKLAAETATKLEHIRGQLGDAAAGAGLADFSPTNDNHIRSLLFEHLGLAPLGHTKTGLAQVDQNTLRELGHPVADLLLEFSVWDKRQTTAFAGKPGGKSTPIADLMHRYADNRAYLPLHINPLGTRTGRRSSNYPNCQNWAKPFRQIVVSRWPGGLVVDCDYSKLEMVLIAWAAGDEDLLAYFTTGEGYVGIAKWLWGRDVTPESDEYRATKIIVLGLGYGMGPAKMAKNLWHGNRVRLASTFEAHERIVRQLHKRYLRRFWRLRRYADAREAEMLETGQVVSAVGQVRHLPGADRNNPSYGHLLNQAVNFPIQCHKFGAEVLTDDLRWIRIETLKPGDRLFGFDENRGFHGRRHWRSTEVLAVEHDEAECFNVELDDGTRTQVTSDHLHLTANIGGFTRWVRTDHLYHGKNGQYSRLVRVAPRPPVGVLWEHGYIAGMFDADGHLSKADGTDRLSVFQMDNAALREVRRILDLHKFRYSIYPSKLHKGSALDIRGGQDEVLRFLMYYRPPRLLGSFLAKRSFGMLQSISRPRVIGVKSIGVHPVVRMSTSTSTYVADGLASHNCLASYVTGSALVDVERELLAVNNINYLSYLRALLATRKKWLTNGPACGIIGTIETLSPDYEMSVVCNEVHDDLVVDLHPAHPKRDLELIVETMRAVPSLRKLVDLSVPLKVGIKVSNRWCGEEITIGGNT